MPRLVVSFMLLVLLSFTIAAEEIQNFSTEELRGRYIKLIDELRCPQCQNQNLQDSDSPIAQDLRRIVLTKLEEGYSDKEITDYLIDRYGDFITYMPRFKSSTYGLWLTPVLLACFAVWLIVLLMRRRRVAATGILSDAEQKKLQQLLLDKNNEVNELSKENLINPNKENL